MISIDPKSLAARAIQQRREQHGLEETHAPIADVDEAREADPEVSAARRLLMANDMRAQQARSSLGDAPANVADVRAMLQQMGLPVGKDPNRLDDAVTKRSIQKAIGKNLANAFFGGAMDLEALLGLLEAQEANRRPPPPPRPSSPSRGLSSSPSSPSSTSSSPGGARPSATSTAPTQTAKTSPTKSTRHPDAAGGKTITVDKPTTVNALAQQHNVNPAVLKAANPSLSENVPAGTKVFVPKVDAKSDPAATFNPSAKASDAKDAGGSKEAQAQMRNLLEAAKRNAQGKSPQGWCLREVQDVLENTKYGDVGEGKMPRLPYARNFAEHLNEGDRYKQMGLEKLNIDNPYDAPPGAIVVVRAGTPGTSHPTAGDIVVKGEGDKFYNDGEMGYGGPQNFPKGNDYVLGVYVPAGGAKGASSSSDAEVGGVPPALKKGDGGKDVETLQARLKERGFDAGASGTFDAQTAAAVREFNASQGIAGEDASKETQAALNPLASAYARAAKPNNYEVKQGDTVDAIAREQNVSVALLRQANPALDAQQRLQAGQKLHIPAVDLEKAPQAAYDATAAAKDPASRIGTDASLAARLSPPGAGLPQVKDRPKLDALKPGDEGDDVRVLQANLEQRGLEVGKPGVYDKATATAVQRFNTENALPGGDRASVETQRALNATAFLYGKSAAPKTEKTGSIDLPTSPDAPFGRVDLSTEQGREVFRQAAKLAGLPESWANSDALRELVNHESGGIVGRPNYTYGSRAEDPSQWKGILNELKAGRRTAESSATGLGQLLDDNVDKYYPAGRKGIGDPVQEAAGMLNYIKERYGNPEVAWGNHSANPNRHQGVPVIYTAEGY